MRMLRAALMRYFLFKLLPCYGHAICLWERAVIDHMRMLHGALMRYFFCFLRFAIAIARARKFFSWFAGIVGI